MKKTMTKEDLYAIMKSCEEYNDDAGFSVLDGKMFIDALSQAGISFDIYTDSDGQIIKPGDECGFWDDSKIGVVKDVFIGMADNETYISAHDNWVNCRKLPTEVWEPVPMEDVQYFIEQYQWPEEKWAKTRSTNGKLEGVRK